MDYNLTELTDMLRTSIHHGLGIQQYNNEGFRINNQFMLPTEQSYNIVLKKQGNSWFITDERQTLNMFNYDEILDSDSFKTRINQLITKIGLNNYNGELVLSTSTELHDTVNNISKFIYCVNELIKVYNLYC